MVKVKNIHHTILSKAWATLKRIDFDYQFSSGKWKRLSRECYNRGNGTAIFLYNPQKGTVILTKQFRMPAYENDNNDGMSIEVCAGAIDSGDMPLETIVREVEEEVGYKITNAEQVSTAYMSPGAITEKMYFFIAEYNDKMKVNEGGGLDSENEDIEVLEFQFEEVLEMLRDQEIKDAKTIMLIQYAQIHKLL
ncbi:NUDIX domain-containing protein [Winogradskyella sp. A3E31]|uniref:NUDIX domain-containing protein n=1 Tax=Winogradskyella sp. A3E31 TaxID=3349637 RepID=UPI00398AF007